MSKNKAFEVCTDNLTYESRLSAFDQELVLRFFSLKNWRDKFRHDIGDFLTEYMEAVSDPDNPLGFDYAKEEENFDRTFTVLQRTLGEFSFSLARTSRGRDTLIRGFSTNHFEAVTLGLQKRLRELEPDNEEQMARLKEILTSAKLDKRFSDMTTGGGKNSPGQLRDRIQFIEDAIATL